MVFVAKFFCCRTASGHDSTGSTTKQEQRPFGLPVIVMHCNQAHVMDVDPARPDIPPLLSDNHIHMDLAANQIQDIGSLTSITTQLSMIHKSSYLNSLHAALLQNIAVLPRDFEAALVVCNQTVLSFDVTPLIAGLCSHSFTKLLADSGSSTAGGSAPLDSDMLCVLLTAVLSKKSKSCSVSLKENEEEEEEEEEEEIYVSKCDSLRSEIDQAFSRYLSEFGFSPVPQCRAHFWLNERATAANGGSDVEDGAGDDGARSVDTSKDRGWSGSSADTTSAGKVMIN